MFGLVEFTHLSPAAFLAVACTWLRLFPRRLSGSVAEGPPAIFSRYKKKATDEKDDTQESSNDGYG
jgi:hypothetical protein